MKNRIKLFGLSLGLLFVLPGMALAQESADASFHDSVVVVLFTQ